MANTVCNSQCHLPRPTPPAMGNAFCTSQHGYVCPGPCCSLALLHVVPGSCLPEPPAFPYLQLTFRDPSRHLEASSWPFRLGRVWFQPGSLTSSTAVGDKLPFALLGWYVIRSRCKAELEKINYKKSPPKQPKSAAQWGLQRAEQLLLNLGIFSWRRREPRGTVKDLDVFSPQPRRVERCPCCPRAGGPRPQHPPGCVPGGPWWGQPAPRTAL